MVRSEVPSSAFSVSSDMYKLALQHGHGVTVVAILIVSSTSLWSRSAAGFTPRSPEVRRAVARGVEFLKSHDDQRVGAKALIGMSMLKSEDSRNDPSVGKAVTAIQTALKAGDASKISTGQVDIYSAGLAAIFLTQLDPHRYESEILLLMEYLRLRQKPHGGWGYGNRGTGDTSMTQYAVLSCWEVTQAGINVPIEPIEKVAMWLLKTQDPSGGFGYQGNVSETFTPVSQNEMRLSMWAAGLGSVYICSDLLGLVTRVDTPDDDLPPALRKVNKRAANAPVQAKTQLDPRLFQIVQARALGWPWQQRSLDDETHPYYCLYALERCMSFRELCEKGPRKRKEVDGPSWYNIGVQYVLQKQAEDGSWKGGCEEVPSTAFAILFMVRSTQKSIAKARGFGDGTLIGGRGLPTDTDGALVGNSGKVVARPLLGPAEQLLAMLEATEVPDYQKVVDLLAELPPEHGEAVAKKHADKLRRLAGNRSAAARTAAVRAMAKSRDIDNVPTLIYALTDPDPQVALDARDALRRISRRTMGFGLTDRPDQSQRRKAIESWKAWYRAIRPDAEFEN